MTLRCRPRGWPGLLLVSALALATTARAGVPVALYPVQGEGLSSQEAADLQDLVLAGLRSAERRDLFKPRPQPVLAPSCGARPSDPCLAKLAGDGAVLIAKAREKQGAWTVTLALLNAQGRKTRAMAFPADLEIQDLRGVNDAMEMLEYEWERLATADRLAPPPSATATATATGSATGTATGSGAALDVTARPPPARRPDPGSPWQETAGTWCTVGGTAMVVGGVIAGLYGKRLSASLEKKYGEGTLRPSDAASYDTVKTSSLVANTLLIGGGLVAVTGLTFWAIAPDVRQVRGRTTVGVAGSF